jgi:hypothetical protein
MLAQVRADRAKVIDPRIDGLSESDRDTLSAAMDVLRRLIDDISTNPA